MATSNETHVGDGIVLGIHLDVGHSSIGWAVTESSTPVVFRGCGTVLFPKDGCLASERRVNRRQRRHIRSTRQRIARLRTLLAYLGVLTEGELNCPGCAWPWKLAA
jgi:CRISPR/Cas system Type II protein with McrA/HNH and RuvC-like nuclease domain